MLCVYKPDHRLISTNRLMQKYQEFEIEARKVFEKKFGFGLNQSKVMINTKNKSFDMVNYDRKVIGDAKYYCNTRGGHIPSAKRSVANEYVWLLQKIDPTFTKFLVIGEDRIMAEKYVHDFKPWLDEVSVYFFKIGTEPELLYQGVVAP